MTQRRDILDAISEAPGWVSVAAWLVVIALGLIACAAITFGLHWMMV